LSEILPVKIASLSVVLPLV